MQVFFFNLKGGKGFIELQGSEAERRHTQQSGENAEQMDFGQISFTHLEKTITGEAGKIAVMARKFDVEIEETANFRSWNFIVISKSAPRLPTLGRFDRTCQVRIGKMGAEFQIFARFVGPFFRPSFE